MLKEEKRKNLGEQARAEIDRGNKGRTVIIISISHRRNVAFAKPGEIRVARVLGVFVASQFVP